MLVIISDLHLTDGSSGTTIDPDAFRIFRERLADLAWAASDRRINNENIYKPVDEIHLLLLGDILDVIRSTKWLDGDIRPWSGQDSRFIEKVRDITDAILQHNVTALSILRSLHEDGIRVPKVRDGHPCSVEKQRIDVHTYYMVGNHDWFFHLPGPAVDQIRESIIQALGLDNSVNEPFPYDMRESGAINKICEEHQVFARHGDLYDKSNYEASFGRDHSSLGDAVVVQLVDRFPYEVESRMKERAPEGLREIDNVRPLDLIPTWVDGLLRKSPDAKAAEEVRNIWNEVVADFLSLDFVKRHHSALKWGLRLSERMSIRKLGNIVPRTWNLVTSIISSSSLLNKLACRLGLSDDYFQYALCEEAFRNPHISYIVYGHTHRHEVVPLRAGKEVTGTEQVVYINSGTWRAVFDLARYRPKDEEFFGYHVMTYLAFFKGGERKGKAFETWSGSLEAPVLEGGPQLGAALITGQKAA